LADRIGSRFSERLREQPSCEPRSGRLEGCERREDADEHPSLAHLLIVARRLRR
jgi:hypothetical protein